MENKDVQSEVKSEASTSAEDQVVIEDQVAEEADTEQTEDDNVTDINSKLEEKKVNDQIKDLESKIEQSEDKYKRLQAEYANYMRRTQQEKETIGIFANEKIITELIPVIDNMERALDACTDKEDALFKGVDLVYKQLKDSLAKFGVEEIEAEDAEFDPNFHMAVMQESVEGVEPNKVVMVLQKGYKLGTKVIRPTMVKVSC
ncbi:nucleotide exchange factor GrpE [Intestinibacter sp.]|uniref:nucleotide exchange factor GrpE n=1 Tax=Intestinibacter sp. TaxID=1965304 RepID=UPI002A75D2EE|nr:nucleotide exchange factor GrpE [Intestinibacter sp.]MDY2737165.1 nucleotide exchange factor GrpE [Intestinibacter sp.]MDY4574305.1 nucleotide exchange factor GrpE [Intestinibacter sp.]